MTPCGRGCCWTPMSGVCARKRTCACHWADHAPHPEPRHSDARTKADPTATQAIHNIMNPRRKKKA